MDEHLITASSRVFGTYSIMADTYTLTDKDLSHPDTLITKLSRRETNLYFTPELMVRKRLLHYLTTWLPLSYRLKEVLHPLECGKILNAADMTQ
jgi:hypothetical protein